MPNNHKGYSLFNEVKDSKLRAFNRLQAMVNINELSGEHAATNYVNNFDDDSKRDLAIMAAWIKRDGMPSVQRQVRGE